MRRLAQRLRVGCSSVDALTILGELRRLTGVVKSVETAAFAERLAAEQRHRAAATHDPATIGAWAAQMAAPARVASIRRQTTNETVSSIEDIIEAFSEYQEQLRQPTPIDRQSLQRVLARLAVSPSAADLSFDVSAGDIVAAIDRARVCAPGSDGLSSIVFKSAPVECATLLANIVARRSFDPFPDAWRESILVPIYKGKGDRLLVESYRPISIAQSAFRIVCDAINFSIAETVSRLVNIEQTAFVRGRRIDTSICETFASAFDAHANARPLAIVFCDVVKAYDTLRFDFILAFLRARGASAAFVSDVERFLCGNAARVCIASRLGKRFATASGVPQGNPLSCSLYILSVSIIPGLIHLFNDERGGYRSDFHSPAGLGLIASMYVDNLVIFSRTVAEVDSCLSALECFGAASGQQICLEKTRVVAVGGFSFPPNHVLTSNLLCDDDSIRVLGVYMNARGGIHFSTWSNLLTSIDRSFDLFRLCRLPSYRQRLMIASTFVLARLYFVASVFAVPSSVIASVERSLIDFLFVGSTNGKFSSSVFAEPAARGGVARNGFSVAAKTQALLAMRVVRAHACRGDNLREWCWRAAAAAADASTGGRFSFTSFIGAPPLVDVREWHPMPVQPNLMALAAFGDLTPSHHQRNFVYADQLMAMPIFANCHFGALLRPQHASGAPTFVGARLSTLLHDDALDAGNIGRLRRERAVGARPLFSILLQIAKYWPRFQSVLSLACDRTNDEAEYYLTGVVDGDETDYDACTTRYDEETVRLRAISTALSGRCNALYDALVFTHGVARLSATTDYIRLKKDLSAALDDEVRLVASARLSCSLHLAAEAKEDRLATRRLAAQAAGKLVLFYVSLDDQSVPGSVVVVDVVVDDVATCLVLPDIRIDERVIIPAHFPRPWTTVSVLTAIMEVARRAPLAASAPVPVSMLRSVDTSHFGRDRTLSLATGPSTPIGVWIGDPVAELVIGGRAKADALTAFGHTRNRSVPAVLSDWLLHHRRESMECAYVFTDANSIFELGGSIKPQRVTLDHMTSALLGWRARALSRDVSEPALARLFSYKQFSFEDFVKIRCSNEDFDFVFRLLHGNLAFGRHIKLGSGVLMDHCPDCGRDCRACFNDHPTLDCGRAVSLFAALNDWFYGILVAWDAGRLAFRRCWHWQRLARPCRRVHRAAWALAVIAKRALWNSFVGRYYSSDERTVRFGAISHVALLSFCKRQFLRRVGSFGVGESWTSIIKQ